jgi:hypothetical protein
MIGVKQLSSLKILSYKILTSIFKDKDLINTGLNQGWRLVSGPLILIFIPLFLTSTLQGYWYSFISLGALSALGDLGFTNIVLQFAAHEYAFLRFNNNLLTTQKEEYNIHLFKISSLFKFSIKWFFIVMLISSPIIFGIGVELFSSKNDNVNWLIPWIIFILGSSLSFLNSVILSFLEGCNQVAKIQKIRLFTSIIYSILVLTTLSLHCALFAIAVAFFISSLLSFIYILIKFRLLIKQMLNIAKENYYNWKNEIFALFWKYVISFGSGYFIFQIYTPLAFKYYGSVEAGKIGFSMTIWGVFYSIATVWIVSVLPKINILVSLKKWNELDNLVKKRLYIGLFTYWALCSIFFIIYFLLRDQPLILKRVTTLNNLLLLTFFWSIQYFISTWAFYLRAHKEEPYLLNSLLSAIYVSLITFLIVKTLPSDYILLGLSSSAALFLPWNYYIFYSKKKKWHKQL